MTFKPSAWILTISAAALAFSFGCPLSGTTSSKLVAQAGTRPPENRLVAQAGTRPPESRLGA